jgi:hypothetical protein
MSADAVLQGNVPGGLATIFQHVNLMARPATLRFAGRAFESLAFLLLSPQGRNCSPTALKRSPRDRSKLLEPPVRGAFGTFPVDALGSPDNLTGQ